MSFEEIIIILFSFLILKNSDFVKIANSYKKVVKIVNNLKNKIKFYLLQKFDFLFKIKKIEIKEEIDVDNIFK